MFLKSRLIKPPSNKKLFYNGIDGIKIDDDGGSGRYCPEARKDLFNKPVNVADAAAWDID